MMRYFNEMRWDNLEGNENTMHKSESESMKNTKRIGTCV